MKKYKITVTNGSGWRKEFESASRNAKKHLRDNYGAQDGARCKVCTKNGETVSACEYSAEFGYYYICA